MEINFSKETGQLNVSIVGRLDTQTAPALERFLSENYDGTGKITCFSGKSVL